MYSASADTYTVITDHNITGTKPKTRKMPSFKKVRRESSLSSIPTQAIRSMAKNLQITKGTLSEGAGEGLPPPDLNSQTTFPGLGPTQESLSHMNINEYTSEISSESEMEQEGYVKPRKTFKQSKVTTETGSLV